MKNFETCISTGRITFDVSSIANLPFPVNGKVVVVCGKQNHPVGWLEQLDLVAVGIEPVRKHSERSLLGLAEAGDVEVVFVHLVLLPVDPHFVTLEGAGLGTEGHVAEHAFHSTSFMVATTPRRER